MPQTRKHAPRRARSLPNGGRRSLSSSRPIPAPAPAPARMASRTPTRPRMPPNHDLNPRLLLSRSSLPQVRSGTSSSCTMRLAELHAHRLCSVYYPSQSTALYCLYLASVWVRLEIVLSIYLRTRNSGLDEDVTACRNCIARPLYSCSIPSCSFQRPT